MLNSELLVYVRSQVAKGMPLDVIRSNLRLGGGWSDEDITKVFIALNVSISGPAPKEIPAPSPVVSQPIVEAPVFHNPTAPIAPAPVPEPAQIVNTMAAPTPIPVSSPDFNPVPVPTPFQTPTPDLNPSTFTPISTFAPPPNAPTENPSVISPNPVVRPNKTKLFVIGGFVLLIIILGLALAFIYSNKSVSPQVTNQNPFGTSTPDNIATST
jgi:hypothetical protein